MHQTELCFLVPWVLGPFFHGRSCCSHVCFARLSPSKRGYRPTINHERLTGIIVISWVGQCAPACAKKADHNTTVCFCCARSSLVPAELNPMVDSAKAVMSYQANSQATHVVHRSIRFVRRWLCRFWCAWSVSCRVVVWCDCDSDGASALHVASINGHIDATRALLRLGAAPQVSLGHNMVCRVS